jgi:ABC-type transport system substrate-binding protein
VRSAVVWAFWFSQTALTLQSQGETVVKKLLIGSMILALGALGWVVPSVGEQPSTPRGELRVVDNRPLNWAWIVWNVFEHLIEVDKHGNLVTRLATSWRWLDERTLEMTLRQGVRFHNGEMFDADIVKLNWEESIRVRQPHVVGNFMNFKPGSRLENLDPYTVRFVFPEPDGGALAKLILMHIGNRQFYRELGWGEKHW